MKVPKKVLLEVKADASCTVIQHEPEYFEVEFAVGSVGHQSLIKWSEGDVIDPLVTVQIDVARVPPATLAGTLAAIQTEAQCIVYHCAPLSAAGIAAAVVIPPPLLGAPPPASVNIHHAKVALTFLLDKLASPPATYPAISALPLGTYVCTILYAYKNSQHRTWVYK